MGDSEKQQSVNKPGSVLKGVLLNIGLNLFICLIWMPLCAIDGSGYGDSAGPLGQLGIIIFLAALYIGLTQLIHVLPLAILFHVRGQTRTNRGMLITAGVVLLLWAVVYLVAMLGG